MKSSCHNCGDFDDVVLLQCSVCSNVVYCSAACQSTHWNQHETVCTPKILQKRKPQSIEQHIRQYSDNMIKYHEQLNSKGD